MTNQKGDNFDHVPDENRREGTIKFPYLQCTCGHKVIFTNAPIQPEKTFSLFVKNTRGNESDKSAFKCPDCKKEIIIGLEQLKTVRDN